MRVISLVPSLTETLLECQVDVVGRTRFCIHPKQAVNEIQTVGGTKGVDWQRCMDLKPDLVIFDREENLKSMAEECPFDWHATTINSIDDVGPELIRLADRLESPKLRQHGEEWINLCKKPARPFSGWGLIPGLQFTLNKQTADYQRLEYLIWRDPWMGIGRDTFIHSMLSKVGFGEFLSDHSLSYPKLSEADLNRSDTFYLFSSEPFPFHRYRQDLLDSGVNGAIVDGEAYSWFGIRSYRHLKYFLEQ